MPWCDLHATQWRYVCVCVCARAHACENVCVCARESVCVCVCARASSGTCTVNTCVHIYKPTCVPTCIYKPIYTCLRVSRSVCVWECAARHAHVQARPLMTAGSGRQSGFAWRKRRARRAHVNKKMLGFYTFCNCSHRFPQTERENVNCAILCSGRSPRGIP